LTVKNHIAQPSQQYLSSCFTDYLICMHYVCYIWISLVDVQTKSKPDDVRSPYFGSMTGNIYIPGISCILFHFLFCALIYM